MDKLKTGTSPLNDVAHKCAVNIRDAVLNALGDKYCIGFHIRNVLDSGAPSVAIAASDDRKAEQIKKLNGNRGLHTFNHVLDSLFYPSDSGARSGKPAGIVVRMTYGMRSKESCHHFDEEPKGKGKGFSAWAGATQGSKKEADEIRDQLNAFDYRYVRMGIRKGSSAAVAQPAPEDSMAALFSPGSVFYDEYICGAQKLCSRLGIPPSILAYRSIMASVFQLGTYAKVFGPDTVTLMLRPASTFGYVIGLTILAGRVIPYTAILQVLSECLGHYSRMQAGVPPKIEERLLMPTQEYRQFSYIGKLTAIPSRVSEILADELCASDPEEPMLMDRDKVRFTVQSFLKMAVSFCDERLEGRELRYGLVLGNAPLMAYWPGPPPRELRGPDGEFLSVGRLPAQVHLLENPEIQCLVVPYIGGEYTQTAPCPTWMLDLEEFEEALSAWPEGIIWSRELRPYVYLTQRYPWAIACVVGPGSQIRVFFRGILKAYRDGKGWRLYSDPVDQIERGMPGVVRG